MYGIYIHPWDLGRLEWLAGLGYRDAAMAVAYHAGRWLIPHPGGNVRYLEDGIVHYRPAPSSGGLQPKASREVPATGRSPLEQLGPAAWAAGLARTAWVVLFHNSRLGRMHPGACVENARGDRVEHALCPARPEVRAYGKRVVAEIAAHELDTVELEAAGFHGYRHGSHHDKSSFTLGRRLDFLLSFCFCAHCREGIDAHGGTAGALRGRVADLVRAALEGGDAMASEAERTLGAGEDADGVLADELGERELAAMLGHRRETCRAVLRDARAALPSGMRLAAHVRFDPLYTGSQLGLEAGAVADLLDEIVVTHYGEDRTAIEKAWHGRTAGAIGTGVRIALWPKAPQLDTDADLRALGALATKVGCLGLRIYHASLLPARTLERVARALERRP